MLLSFVYIASHPRRVFRFPFLCHVPPARRCSQVLSCHLVCRLPLLKLFRIISLQKLRGGCVAPTFRPSDFPPYLTYPLSFHSLPHSFALTKNAALLFSIDSRSEEHTSELQSRGHLVCRLLLEKKKDNNVVILFIE